MAIPIPLLLLAGAVGIKALSNRGDEGPPQVLCTPEGVFGKAHFPLSKGGYPILAAAYVEDWLEDTKSGGSSVFYQNAATKFADVGAKYETAQRNWEDAGAAQPINLEDYGAAVAHLDAETAQWVAAKKSAVTSSWSIADQILKSIGCPVATGSSEGLRQILVNEESWVRWLLAMGVYVNLSFHYVGEPPDTPSPMEILQTSFEFIDAHFRRGLSMDLGKGQIEGAQYTSALRPLLNPLPGAAPTLYAAIQAIEEAPWTLGNTIPKWLFGPLTQGAQPWTEFEAKMQGLAALLSNFLTGSNSDPDLEQWMFSDNILGGWLAIDLTGKKPTTDAGYAIMSVISAQTIGALSPHAYPDWEYLTTHDALQGLPGLPFSSVRGIPDETFWEWHDAYIREALSQEVSPEDIAVKLLGTQAAGANELVRIFPSYDGFFQQNPGAVYEDYVVAIDAFNAKYPIVAAAISNLHSLIISHYQLEVGDMGF